MFETAREMLERYHCFLLTQGGVVDHAGDVLCEIRTRLRELEWLYARIVQLDHELVEQYRPAGAPAQSIGEIHHFVIFHDRGAPDCETFEKTKSEFRKNDELRILLEAFYYSANRVREISKTPTHDLPRLSKFDAVGVRGVRNHLIEHPDKKLGVTLMSLSVGGPDGPKLKRLRHTQDEGVEDRGLHANATEFCQALEKALSRALAKRVAGDDISCGSSGAGT